MGYKNRNILSFHRINNSNTGIFYKKKMAINPLMRVSLNFRKMLDDLKINEERFKSNKKDKITYTSLTEKLSKCNLAIEDLIKQIKK